MPDEPVPEPDALDQQRSVDPDDDLEDARLQESLKGLREREREASEADLLDQAEPADVDEEA
jgi:hypothetical protein